ncbi:MAG: acetyl-CoA carboxylase biotin carboxyl carrier protein subunit [Burkholderiaceae bacterium]
MTTSLLRAPMACSVVEVPVTAGQAVRAGQTLIVLEAMKMEHELRAEHDATVLQVDVRPGETVAEGDVLMRLGPPASGPIGAAAASVDDDRSDDSGWHGVCPAAGAMTQRDSFLLEKEVFDGGCHNKNQRGDQERSEDTHSSHHPAHSIHHCVRHT